MNIKVKGFHRILGSSSTRKFSGKLFTMILTLFVLAGCNTNGDNNTTPSNVDTPSSQEKPLTPEERFRKGAEEMRKAEEEEMKKIPTFDHSDSLEGPDANNDGIRDDIEAYIEGLGLPPRQKESLRKLAKGLRNTLLVDLSNEEELMNATNSQMQAIDCMYASFSGEELEKAQKYREILQAANANTQKRTQQYIEYNLKLSGKVFSALEYNGDPCHEE